MGARNGWQVGKTKMFKGILAAAVAAAATAEVCVSASWVAATASSRRDFRGVASSPAVSEAAIEAAALIFLPASLSAS